MLLCHACVTYNRHKKTKPKYSLTQHKSNQNSPHNVCPAPIHTQLYSKIVTMAKNKDDAINEAKLILVNGCICCNSSLYPEFPDCIGCSGKSELLCCVEQLCCKMGTPPLLCDTPEGHCCQLGCGCCSWGMKSPTTCCKGQCHQCCFVSSFALPPDEEVPCTLAFCGNTPARTRTQHNLRTRTNSHTHPTDKLTHTLLYTQGLACVPSVGCCKPFKELMK